jgi:hypothetical protein
MKPIKITMKKEYSWREYIEDVIMFDKENSLLGSIENAEGQIVFIIDKDKSKILKQEKEK